MNTQAVLNLEDTIHRCNQYRRQLTTLSQEIDQPLLENTESYLEIMDVIYHCLMRKNDEEKFIDVFLQSKKQGYLSQRMVLQNTIHVMDACSPSSQINHHAILSPDNPDYCLAMGLGISLANQLQQTDSHTYMIISYHELQYHSNWDLLALAANLKLTNLIIFLNLNDMSLATKIKGNNLTLDSIMDTFISLGWYIHATNGYNSQQLYSAAKTTHLIKPTLIICEKTLS